MIILILWTAIVSGLVNETHTYNKCKNNDCIVVIKNIGYSIEVKNK